MQINYDPTDYYKPGSQLLAAINLALFLQRPLLLSGEPGTGKTECANFIARQLHKNFPEEFVCKDAIRFNTKSVSQSSDLFYDYDAVAHFGDKTGKQKEAFINFNGLGVALLNTNPVNEQYDCFANYKEVMSGRGGETGSVVLIDEIDKAPRDFPNDLLAELEKPPFKFGIKEIPGFQAVQNEKKPLVLVITSNNEKGLPDAFLRRCVFHHINFPGASELLEIVKSKFNKSDDSFAGAIDLFLKLRAKREIAKQPATSELIDWIACLKERELLNGNLSNLENAEPYFRAKLADTLGVITKTKADFETISKAVAAQ